MTNNLSLRVAQHKSGAGSEFTARYNVSRLVWYEQYEDVRDAIAREKQLKKWNRAWKMTLIEGANPDWRDLYLDLNA
jgi:putative endonuclease